MEPEKTFTSKGQCGFRVEGNLVGKHSGHVSQCKGECYPERHLDPREYRELVRAAAFLTEQLPCNFTSLQTEYIVARQTCSQLLSSIGV